MLRHVFLALQDNPKALAGCILFLIFMAITVFAPWIAPFDPHQVSDNQGHFALMAEPNAKHWLGTNHAGQDIFSRFIYGARLTLLVGIITGSIMTFISLVIGLLGGYLGGRIDELLAFFTNIFLVIPGLPLIILLAAYIPFNGIIPIILVLSLTGWAWGARIIRAQVLTLRQREYVAAAVVLGESQTTILFREILPNMSPLVMATLFTSTLAAILGEATLSFIGLGDISVVTWGTMLFWAKNQSAMLYGAWWWLIPPGLGIALLGTAFALLNFAIDEISNPKMRRY